MIIDELLTTFQTKLHCSDQFRGGGEQTHVTSSKTHMQQSNSRTFHEIEEANECETK